MRRWTILCTLVAICPALGAAALATRAAAAGDAAALAEIIDRHIEARLADERLEPAALASDAEFLRRVYLDLHGVVPTADQAAQFLHDSRPNRRARLINALLASPRYGEYLADLWQGYLVSPLADDPSRVDDLRPWLAEQFNNQSWDRIATDILTAKGKIEENPAVIYLVEGRLPRTVPDLTDLATRYFLGIRLSCAQCHDHPFAQWTQQDYWGMAAFFTQIQTPGRPKQVYQLGVRDNPQLTLASLQEDAMVDGFLDQPPTFLGGEPLGTRAATPHRAALAAWMTSPANPYFARAMVNRTWGRLFGRGIVHPVDDMLAANPPSHPELLDALSRQFIESGYDLKFLTQGIVLSRAYQRASHAAGAPDQQAELFGRMAVKVLSPGQLWDSLVTVFGQPATRKGPNQRGGARREFTEFFAQDGEDSTAYLRGIPHALRLMNSGQFARQDIAELAPRLASPRPDPDEVAQEIYLKILARRPTAAEQQIFREHFEDASSLPAAARELAWALMMSSEFSLIH